MARAMGVVVRELGRHTHTLSMPQDTQCFARQANFSCYSLAHMLPSSTNMPAPPHSQCRQSIRP